MLVALHLGNNHEAIQYTGLRYHLNINLDIQVDKLMLRYGNIVIIGLTKLTNMYQIIIHQQYLTM